MSNDSSILLWLALRYPESAPRVGSEEWWLECARRARPGRADRLLEFAQPPRAKREGNASDGSRNASRVRGLRFVAR